MQETLTAEVFDGPIPGSEFLPMKRDTIEEIVDRYNRTVAQLEVAYAELGKADVAVQNLNIMARQCCPSGLGNINHERHEEIKAFYRAVSLPDRDQYLTIGRKILTINVWSHIIETTRLESLMDLEAKEAFRKQMAYDPPNGRRGEVATEKDSGFCLPPITVDNIVATVEAFVADAPNIMARGIAKAFSRLDRRFRSHDGFKIGGRIIITNAVSDYGGINWGRVQDTLIDVERVFTVLDGRPDGTFTQTLQAVANDRQGRGSHQSVTETEYFRIRGYLNGNIHLWFKREDLLDKVNQILGKYYGDPLGDETDRETVHAPDPLKSPKTEVAKYFGFYPTPAAAANKVIEAARLGRREDTRPLRILEPSAGTGNLARLAASQTYTDWGPRREYELHQDVDCIEIQPHLATQLREAGIYRSVTCADFLNVTPKPIYDRVIMNPPFDRERDIDHVMHALEFLNPDGVLVAIMSAGTEFRETKKSVAFRKLMDDMRARWDDLPAGSFSEVGTNVNTLILTVHKNKSGRY